MPTPGHHHRSNITPAEALDHPVLAMPLEPHQSRLSKNATTTTLHQMMPLQPTTPSKLWPERGHATVTDTLSGPTASTPQPKTNDLHALFGPFGSCSQSWFALPTHGFCVPDTRIPARKHRCLGPGSHVKTHGRHGRKDIPATPFDPVACSTLRLFVILSSDGLQLQLVVSGTNGMSRRADQECMYIC